MLSRRGWFALVSLAAMAVMAAIVVDFVCSLVSLSALRDVDDSPAREEVESLAPVRLPPDAGDLRARLQTVITKRWLLARFSIAPSELPDLLASGGFPPPSTGPSPYEFSLVEKPDWWTSETVRSYVKSEIHRSAILVDQDRPDRYVIYLVRRL